MHLVTTADARRKVASSSVILTTVPVFTMMAPLVFDPLLTRTWQGGESGYISNCPALVSPGSGGDGVLLDPVAVAADAVALGQPAGKLLGNEPGCSRWLYTTVWW